ncbi:hypothetical protein [Atlanticothrix silvestris]|uniref:hypothetical protein n=1 Tax=Atlanticothrix silvestris TaxID=2840444 RepID=UPI001CEC9593|nr:hypothetical protein [Atlanticothrix silvestris]
MCILLDTFANGNAADMPVLRASDLTALNTNQRYVSSTSIVLTSPPAPLLRGEGSKTIIFPRLLGEGDREGEVCRTHLNGSFESIVEVPESLSNSAQIQLLVDNGDTVWYNNGTISKDLAQDNFQKFRS